ncbi:MAG: TIGR00266 family protein [Ruminococcaceae bacterium]|nr:TIGR00266 family protein [Oscillospiraceae bacterium]
MEYKIIGGSFPAVSCKLQNGESMIAESGSMIWMSPNMEMTTQGGGIGNIFSRAFSGERLFQNVYTAHGQGVITFGSSFPGEILTLQIAPGKDVILQKTSFLASEVGVQLSIHFNRKLGVGFFGGEGFIMQRLSGYGLAFAEIAGDLVEYTLDPGRQLVVSTGNLVGFESTVQLDIRQVPGLKNKFLGGEGFFNTILTGPGKIWLQTTSISGMAATLAPYIPTSHDN